MTEIIKLPNKVIDSEWKDDIDYEPYGSNKQEMEYISPTEVSKESIEKIKSQKRGGEILSLFSKNEKLAA